MRKLMLKVENLEVESFDTVSSQIALRGTIKGASFSETVPSCGFCPTLSCKPSGQMQCFPSPC